MEKKKEKDISAPYLLYKRESLFGVVDEIEIKIKLKSNIQKKLKWG